MGNQLEQEWQTVSGAPFLTIAVVIVIGFAVWAILHFLYRHRIDGLKEEVERLRAREPTPSATANQLPVSAPVPPRPAAKKRKGEASADTEAEVPPQPADRVFVGSNVTPGYLTALFDGVTKVQGHRRTEVYIGKWMRISGTVKNVYPSGRVAINHPDRKPVSTFMLKFEAQMEKLEILHPGDKIEAIGRIDSIDQFDLMLEACEFLASG